MDDFRKRAEELYDQTVKDRRTIHAFAGTKFDLEESKDYIVSRLNALKIEWEEICKCGIKAQIGRGDPVFLLRADYDALPFREQSGVAFASEKDSCHACGHDMHCAMLLCAAQMLKECEEHIKGTVILAFQPAEEGAGGCKTMIQAGLLENPKVSRGLAIHVATGTELAKTGTIHYSIGPAFSASSKISITVRGKGGHGAQPHTAIDPVTAAANILVALQHILALEIEQGTRVALTFGQIYGGNAPNVIPDEVTIKGTCRTYDDNITAFMKERITTVAIDVAKAMRCEAEVDIETGEPPVINDPSFCNEIYPFVEQVTGKGKTVVCNYPTSFGSEDFAMVTSLVPSVILKLGAGSPEDGHFVPLHNPKVIFEEKCLPIGAAAYANVAYQWLKQH